MCVSSVCEMIFSANTPERTIEISVEDVLANNLFSYTEVITSKNEEKIIENLFGPNFS